MLKFIWCSAIAMLSIALSYLLPSISWTIGFVSGAVSYGVFDHFQSKEAR
jgi:hypothetical protein